MTSNTDQALNGHNDRRDEFSRLHGLESASGSQGENTDLLVMPNPWDVGSAVMFAGLGFKAVATTSSGFAASLGRADQQVARVDVVRHAGQVAAALAIPVNVDSEDCFPREQGGIEETAKQLLAVGAAGFSIEDYDPVTGEILPVGEAVERVRQVCEVARGSNCVVTARAENHLRGNDNLDDTIDRLHAYHQAGAHCLYAPGIKDLAALTRIVDETNAPINVLLYPDGPSIAQLRDIGVRRVSTGGTLAKTAFSAAIRGAKELLGEGSSTYASGDPSWSELSELFAAQLARPDN